MFKHILIPTDGSALSHKAVVAGVNLARTLGARVTGVYAAPPATPLVYGDHLPVGYATPKEHERMIKASAARHLGTIAQMAKKAKVPCSGVSMTSDYPAEVILAVAKKEKCDLIVMASHGRRGLKGVLLGSETQKVLTLTKIPVLVCR